MTTDGSGNAALSFTPTTQVSAGQYVSATATNKSTNDTSEFSKDVKVDTAPSAPGAPALSSGSSSPNQGVFSLSWTASTDKENDPITYTLQHSSDAGATFQDVASGLTSNSYSFTSAAPEKEGTWLYRVQASDGTLSSGYSGNSTSVTVDKTPPSTPTGLTLDASSDSGVKGDNITNVATPTFNGTAEKGSTVKLYEGNTSLGSTTADSSTGAWSITSSKLTEGAHQITATATDAAGNTSAASDPVTVTVDTKAPTAPVITSPADNSYETTGSFSVKGTAEKGSTLELFEGNTSVGKTTVDPSGNFSVDLSGVSDGSHTYTARTTDTAGNTSAASDPLRVTVDTKAPPAPVITSPANNSHDSDGNFSVKGIAEANSTVELFEGTTSKGKAAVVGFPQ